MYEPPAMASLRRRIIAPVLAAALAFAATLTAPSSAQAKDDNAAASPSVSPQADSLSLDSLEPELLAEMRRQEPLHAAVAILTEAAMALPESGFMSVDFDGDGLVLYWKGGMPVDMQSAVTAARAIGPVQILQAAYSKAGLEAEAAKIENAVTGPNNIQSIELRGDGSGLIIEQMPPATAAIVRAKAGEELATAADAITQADVNVAVSITTAAESMKLDTCAGTCRRTDDEASWNSGGRVWMKHNAGDPNYYGGCTGGFAVYVPAWGGTTALLTAAHCATWHAGQGDWFYDGAGELIGRASINEDWDKDIMLIDAPGWYWMWDGTTTTTTHKTVHSWGYAAGDMNICHSGASTGTYCYLTTSPDFIYSYTVTDSDGDTFPVHGMVRACRNQGTQAPAQNGDSGGPYFTLDGDGVRAMGVHSGSNSTCTFFQDMADVTTDRSGAWVHAIPYTD